ncbi:MAG: YitT family protein, partial [Clostridia bacterium]|nr:YitT family protein [Clostridia bacterium]
IILGAFVFKNLILALLGIMVAFIESFVIDKVFLGGEKAFIAHIYSKNSDEINKQVIEVLQRTTTIVAVKGGYTGKESTMLTVSFTMNQYADLMNIINKADKDAFVTIQQAHQINGEGWK